MLVHYQPSALENKIMEKEANDYLKSLFENIQLYVLTPDEEKTIKRDMVGFIVDKLTRKKFRRKKLSENRRKDIEGKIKISVKANEPIHFTIPFGAYKHFWNNSHPEPDWAEMFNFRYLTEYVLPVLAVYKPGVILEYISEDMIMTRMDNYPSKFLEDYSKVFTKLVGWYNKLCPKNLEIKYFRVGDRCDKEKIIDIVEKLLPERRKEFDKLSDAAKEQELHRSHHSVMWNGEKDLTSLDDSQKLDRMIESRLIELAYYDTEAQPEFLGDYLEGENHICICFSFGLSHDNDMFDDLTLGSTFGSIVDHWIGRGVLEYHDNKFTPNIVSKDQLEKFKANIETVNINPQILPYKNYKTIDIITHKYD